GQSSGVRDGLVKVDRRDVKSVLLPLKKEVMELWMVKAAWNNLCDVIRDCGEVHILPARFGGERVENLFPRAVVAANSDAAKKSGWFAPRVESEFETVAGLNPRHRIIAAVASRDQFFAAGG